MYRHYSKPYIYFRRTLVVVVGVVTFPIMVCTSVDTRSKLYSYLHRVWLKTSDKPVWLEESEHALQELY
ncbi:DUF2517 domain-containing protein [Photobacterium sanctipauli]|uniref:DUF2517 domain-containing protein n=1 Tax=Photobacterium sanctipauli TaxID=1342794 RepID=A0A2T3NRB3_9GAMM|nr:DUF2517 family protein [Photobacterium sanctipauli]PSW18772.1 DUF2517 domain-containing protein [Photobacterium sanctipauli]